MDVNENKFQGFAYRDSKLESDKKINEKTNW